MRQLHRKLGLVVVLAAALTVGWLYAQAQQVRTCGTTIGVSGNYALANDIGPCRGDGVTITANNVTFDLAGHTIRGISSPASCNMGAPQIGITVTTGANNVQIGGGTVTGFVDGIAFGASNSRVASMSVTNNCVNGMVVSNATNVTVEANTVTGSGNDGLLLLNADGGTFQANNISSNGRFGVVLVSGSDHNTIRDNSMNNNGAAAGGAGLSLVGGTDTQILRNTVQGNLQGIVLHTGGNVVQGNIANSNQTVGITVADVAGDNRIDGNTATGNSAFDLTDVNAHCGTNTWQNGVFLTDDVAGVPDGGPGAGCIKGLADLACVDGACPGAAKAVLLAQTGAVDVTGPLPELGHVQGAVTVGDVTLEGQGLFVGVARNRRVAGGDWTPLLPGPDIALAGLRKELSITFPVPMFTAGFDFVEPETGPNVGPRFSDTTFLLTLEREGVSLRQMAFNAPNDVVAFINVVSDVGFDKMVLSPLAAFRRTDLAFGTKMLGNIYAGRTPVFARSYNAVVLDFPVLFKVNPGDGFRTVLTNLADNTQGDLLFEPRDVAVEKSRQILLLDEQAGISKRGALFRIDPISGKRAKIHDFGIPASQGTPLGARPIAIGLESSGNILVLDAAAGTFSLNPGNAPAALFRVNAGTNVRTLLNDFGTTAEGPRGRLVIDVAGEPSGRILVLDRDGGTGGMGVLYRIDPTTATRKRTPLSDFGIPDPITGERVFGPTCIAVEASGSILVVARTGGTKGRGALYRVNPNNGLRTRLSGDLDLQAALERLIGVAVAPDGTILVVDHNAGNNRRGAIFGVDPASGKSTILSDFGQFLPSENLGADPVRIAVLP